MKFKTDRGIKLKIKQKKFNKKNVKWMNAVPPLILLILILTSWEIYVAVSGISARILPAPHVIFGKLGSKFMRDLFPDFIYSIKVILSGYCISIPCGILLAAICSQSKYITKAITPVLIILVVIPMLTLVPILQLWYGYVMKVRIIVVICQAVPIICLNTLRGFTKVEVAKRELFRSLGATRFQTFIKLIFPNALPQVFVGLKLGCIFSTIAAMGADLAASNEGLGSRISVYSGMLMTDMAYGTIIVVALIGIVLFSIVARLEKKVVVWIK